MLPEYDARVPKITISVFHLSPLTVWTAFPATACARSELFSFPSISVARQAQMPWSLSKSFLTASSFGPPAAMTELPAKQASHTLRVRILLMEIPPHLNSRQTTVLSPNDQAQ